MNGFFYVRYAARALYRNGQRSVLALVCIAFGVLSLVGLHLLSVLLSDAFLLPPRISFGGDLALARDGRLLTTADTSAVEALQARGLVGPYTFVAPGHALLLRTERTGRVFFINRAQGVDPATFPLVGTLRISRPAGASFAQAVAAPGDVVITDDLAEQLDLTVGAGFTLTGAPGSAPIRLRVGGIAAEVPDRIGRSLFYSLETARRIADRPEVAARVTALWGPQGDTGPRLEQDGWTVDRPSETPDSAAADLFGFMLPGAGILGLLIGGIGVANTMQVILARRTAEIATLKALGYGQGDLLLLFGIETVLLGTLGSAVGVAGGLLLAHRLVRLIEANLLFMLDFTIHPGVVAGGLATGVLVAVIFGLAAMVRASGVRPGVLLRNLRVRRSTKTRLATAGLYGVLLILFGILSSVILGSAVQGFGIVTAGVAGLAVLGAVLGALLLAATRVPAPGMPLLGMARRNLRHRPLRATSALVALFVGVFSIGFATAALFNAQERARARAGSLEGDNLLIYAGLADTATVRARLDEANARARAGYQVAVQVRSAAGEALPQLDAVEGRRAADGEDVTLREGTWPPPADAVFVPLRLQETLARGDTLRVTAPAGEMSLRVAGFYEPPPARGFSRPLRGLLTTDATARRLGGAATSVVYMLALPPATLDETAQRLGEALPQTLLVTKTDVIEVMNRSFRGLFFFVIAIAGLSFVAGAVLIANAVGLAMLERRRELGILKAIGFTSRNVLQTVLLENAILGVLSGLTGLAAVFIAMAVINLRFPDTGMALTPGQALTIVGIAVALALGSATLVAWRPTHVRPLAVLRDE